MPSCAFLHQFYQSFLQYLSLLQQWHTAIKIKIIVLLNAAQDHIAIYAAQAKIVKKFAKNL
jgi:DNA polymerase II small subunit/DNA polymerase delta subunit B